MDTAALLRNVRLLSGLSDELLERLADEVGELHVEAGGWVLREGDQADRLFIVRSGRIEVIDEGPPEVLIRVLRRGDVLGELALLSDTARSASARARRDTDLLVLHRDAFEALIQEAPSFALGLTRAMGAQLAASRAPLLDAKPPRTVAVLGLDRGAPVDEAAAGLAQALRVHGTLAHLSGGDLATIDQAEGDADRVLLAAGVDPEEAWTQMSLREADLVVAITGGVPAPEWLQQADALRGCELLVFGAAIAPEVLERLAPREAQVVAQPAERQAALDALGRRIAGRSLGVVLSGGGARALAHIGAIEELQAAGLQIDRVAGVSAGSLVGATIAAGFAPHELYDVFKRNFVDTNPSNDYVPPAYSLLRGAKGRRLLTNAFGDRRIEELPLRFFCLSCDLVAREPVLHGSGPVIDALYASFAIPAVFPPVATADGRLLVDGGVLDNLPVETMAQKQMGPVIAVDVTGKMAPFSRPGRPRLAPLGRSLRRVLTGRDVQIPRLGETIMRTVTVGSIDTSVAARLHANLVITPRVDGIALMDWKALPRVVELGRNAARAALAGEPDLPSRLGL